MFDNAAINAVIGLIAIYLLYSLLITIVSEILSNWLGLRPRVLRVAIERMLNDSPKDRLPSPVIRRTDRIHSNIDPRPVNTGHSPRNTSLSKSTTTLRSNTDLSRTLFANFLLRDHNDFQHTFAGRFYAQPGIKY